MSYLINGKEYMLDDIEDAIEQIAQLTKELDQLAAKCAEMRSVAQENDIQCLLDVIEGELPASESDGLDEYSRAAWKLCDVVRSYQSKLASNQCGAGWLSPEQRDHLTNKVAHLQNSLDVALHQKKVLVEALERMAGYAETVRLDRRKVVDGEIMCLQMEDWCNGLLERVEQSKQALEVCNDL